MEIRLLLFLAFLFSQSAAIAQQTISGIVENGNSKPISNAHVLDINSRKAVATDQLGQFELSIADTGTVLRISHVGHRPVLQTISVDFRFDFRDLHVLLTEQSTLLTAVEVNAGEKTVINGRLGVVLRDFSFADGNLMLMAEDGIRYLVVCDENWKEISRIRVDKKGYRLYEDCFGNAHLFGEDSVYQISINNGNVQLQHAFSQEYFLEQMAHCSTSSESHIFFSSYQKAGQEVYHYGLHRDTKEGTILQRVYDHQGLQDIKDYYADLPHQRAFNRRFRRAGSSFERERLVAMRDRLCAYSSNDFSQSGNRSYCIDNYTYSRYRTAFRNTRPPSSRFSIGSSSHSMLGTPGQYFRSVSNRALEWQNAMLNTWSPSPRDRGWIDLLSQPTYSPMLNLRDSIYVFDHVVGICYVHDNEGNEVRSFPLEHQEHNGWRNLLIPDSNGKKVYAHMRLRNKVYLMEVDLDNGALLSSTHLKHAKFVEHLKVKDGYAYYLKEYRDIHDHDQMMRQKL